MYDMKSYNHLYEKLINDENILLAEKNACKHKTIRKDFKNIYKNPEKYLNYFKQDIKNYKNAKHKSITIYDGIQRKKRNIIVPTYREQVAHHAIVNILKPIIMKSMYAHSYGSLPERGVHKAKRTIEKWLRQDEINTKYCLKMDIKKYFESIPHDILKEKLNKHFHDEKFLNILYEIIDVNDVGLPLGFYTSQWLANWYLSDLDHFIKEQLQAKYYIRYMDDMVIFSNSKEELHLIKTEVENFLNKIGLNIKQNYQIFPINKRFLDFMGFKFYRKYTLLRRSLYLKIKHKVNHIIKKLKPNIHDIRQMVSYYGWLKYSDTYNFLLDINKKIKLYNYPKYISIYTRRNINVA